MRYNTRFTVRDMFCNERLKGVVPQLTKEDLTGEEMRDEQIFEQCRDILCNALGGTVTDGKITVDNKPKAAVLAVVRSYTPLLESMFGNLPSIAANIRKNTRLYTTVASISQLEHLETPKAKRALLRQILDNLNYNPDFNSPDCVPSASPLPFRERQEQWKKKVNYKEKKQ